MRLTFAIIIFMFVLCTFVQATKVTKQAAKQDEADISILNTVKTLKSKQFIRSLSESDTGDDNLPTGENQTLMQLQIWVPILLAIILFFSVMSIVYMDLNKDNDTLVYAKFITSYK